MTSVLVLTPWFPNVPGDREGNFVFDSVRALVRLGLSIDVLVARSVWSRLHPQRRHRALSGRLRPAAFKDLRRVELVRYATAPRYMAPRLGTWMHDTGVGHALRGMARAGSADIIHVHTEDHAPIAVRVGEELGIPVVVTVHGVNTAARHLGSTFRRRRTAGALSAAGRVVLVGEALRQHFGALDSVGNFRVVPNGVNPPPGQPRPRFASPAEPVRFISVANLHEGKGIDIAIRALASATGRGFTQWFLTIVGNGGERAALVALAARLGLSGRVRFLGARPHTEIQSLLDRADVFVLPSYREAFGVAYLEAMASGLLTIGVRGQGPSAFITHGETGVLVEPRSVDDLAANLLEIERQPERMRAMAAAGAAHVRSAFTWDAHARKLMDVYAELLTS